jgi:rubrerythrin
MKQEEKDKLRQLIKEALADEKHAPIEYMKLLRQAKTLKDKRTIRGIIKDEKRHYKLVKNLKR